jgi:hypothetical protein
LLFLCALASAGLALASVLLLPTTYRTAGVLEAWVPQGLWEEAVASAPDRWVQSETQRLFATQELWRIVREVASDAGGVLLPEGSADRLRRRLKVRTLDADVAPGRAGGVVRFEVAGSGEVPGPLRDAVERVAHLYLQQNPPAVTPRLPADPAAGLRADLAAREEDAANLDAQIESLQALSPEQNPDWLPATEQTLLKVVLERNALRDQFARLTEKQRTLEAQLAGTSPVLVVETEVTVQAPTGPTRTQAADAAGQDQLRHDLSNSGNPGGHSTPGNPVQSKPVAPTENGNSTEVDSKDKLAKLETQLAALRRILGSRNPDVMRLAREAEELRRDVAPPVVSPEESEPKTKLVTKEVPNPAYRLIESEISGLIGELTRLQGKVSEAEERLSSTERRLAEGRSHARRLAELRHEREKAMGKIQGLQTRIADSDRASNEETIQPERATYRVLQVPSPSVPIGPHRALLSGVAVLGALLVSLLIAIVRDRLDRSVKSPEQLAALSAFPVLGILPHAPDGAPSRLATGRRIAWVAAIVAASVLSMTFVTDLDSPLATLRTELRRSLHANDPF